MWTISSAGENVGLSCFATGKAKWNRHSDTVWQFLTKLSIQEQVTQPFHSWVFTQEK